MAHTDERTLAPGERVLITGAAGFIGSAITRCLLGAGAKVRAVVEPGGDEKNLDSLDVERVTLDLRDRSGVADVVEGCRVVFHTAAIYRFWAPDPQIFYDVNVGGTRNVIESAVDAGCERVIYTSTVGTVGLDSTEHGVAADETAYAKIDHLFGLYKQSKYVAEHEVLRMTAEGAPVSLALPTFPLGPGDRRPTPTGKLVLDYLNGRLPAYVDTALNVAHVDDLAYGHLLAFTRGRVGRSYIFGGKNLDMGEMLQLLAEITGLPKVTWRVPGLLGVTAGRLSELVQGRLLHREPAVPLEAARMSSTRMIFDNTRAREELGFSPRPPAEALEASARWYVENGYVKAARVRRLRWTAAD